MSRAAALAAMAAACAAAPPWLSASAPICRSAAASSARGKGREWTGAPHMTLFVVRRRALLSAAARLGR